MILGVFLFIVLLAYAYMISSLNAQFSTAYDMITYANEKEEEIQLRGSLTKYNSLPLSELIGVIKNPLFINVVMFKGLKHVSIQITNESGDIAYHSRVDTSDRQQVLICISHWNPGRYTVHFTMMNDDFLIGNFEI